MFKRIMVPVDLAHREKLGKAITTAADLARHFGADLVLVGATSNEPSSVAKSPEAYAEKLSAVATEVGESRGIPAEADTLRLPDVTVDLNRALARRAEEIGADLIVMASHVPGIAEYIFGSHGGEIAQHAKMSVMLVRG